MSEEGLAMGGSICGDEVSIKKGPWTPEEDIVLASYIQEHGPRNWRSVPINTGLMRCSKSCRLRWTNYLRPGIKRGNFTPHEERIIIRLQGLLGNRWAAIASYLPQRTDNDIKNYWNTHLKKKIKKEKEAADRYATTMDSTRGRLRGLAPRGCYPGATIPEISTLHPTVPRFLHTPPTYASNMENISRLLKTWMKPITDSSATTASTSTSTSTLNKISTAPAKLEQHESIRCINDFNNNRNCSNALSPQEQLDSLLSLENLCIDGSSNSSRDAISRSVQSAIPDGEEVKQKFNRNQAPVSFFETWLMDEEIEQMDGLMMQWQEQ